MLQCRSAAVPQCCSAAVLQWLQCVYTAIVPLYEYDCRDCGEHAEILIRGHEAPECPACHGANLDRALSTFAVTTGGRPASAAPSPCGRCGDPRGPGACSMN